MVSSCCFPGSLLPNRLGLLVYPGFAIITWNNPKNRRNPVSPRDLLPVIFRVDFPWFSHVTRSLWWTPLSQQKLRFGPWMVWFTFFASMKRWKRTSSVFRNLEHAKGVMIRLYSRPKDYAVMIRDNPWKFYHIDVYLFDSPQICKTNDPRYMGVMKLFLKFKQTATWSWVTRS